MAEVQCSSCAALSDRIVSVVSRVPFDPKRARGGLFDPPKVAAPNAGTAGSASTSGTSSAAVPPPITVTEASSVIRRAVESAGRQRIVGEVSNFTHREHWYFTLKDDKSQLECVMWASANARSTITPANGMQVILTGDPTHWGPRGRTQLVVTRVERVGEGSLQQRYEELCRTLREQGYFDEARKCPLPDYPRAIAVITSATGAALQDVLRTARLRAPFVRILVVDVPVQGDAAAPAIARAIDAVDRRADELGIDAMIVTRGGGSLEDLWAFNERIVADAVFRATTPVVAAIGHESDTTIIELVADQRASTPTAAVMALLPDSEGMTQQTDHLHDRLQFLMRRRIHELRRAVESHARHTMFRSPTAVIDLHRAALLRSVARLALAARARINSTRHRLSDARTRFERHRPAARHAAARERLFGLDARLHSAARRTIGDLRSQLAGADRQLRLLGPGETLARGWSLTFAADGTLIRSAADARPGQEIESRLADGTVRSRVISPDVSAAPSLFDPPAG
ncbi:MAG: exodeoxyribonuclease VII large subunit [Planctomycetota bacterium]|nr:MAG: exodeoxyribonuclease VII large subunit [Planctomycetota bacterium]